MSPSPFPSLVLLWATCTLTALIACSDEPTSPKTTPTSSTTPTQDASADIDEPDLPQDTGDNDTQPDAPTPPPIHVTVDLDSVLTASQDPNDRVRVERIDTTETLLPGPNAQGRIGDYVLENQHIRVIVEGDSSAISACPYGGNIIDSAQRRTDGTWPDDVVGEICPLLNIGTTFRPQRFRVLHPGGQGQVGVLAVDGSLETWDFLNLVATASDFLGGIELNVALNPNRTLPFQVTIYYILIPGEREVRVWTAMRNDGDAREYTAFGHMIRGGGDGDFTNPWGSVRGYGYRNFGVNNPQPDPLSILGYLGQDTGFLYIPEHSNDTFEDIPTSGSHIASSGLMITLWGNLNLLEVILTPPTKLDTTPGIHALEPGETLIQKHRYLVVGEPRTPSFNRAYDILTVDTETVQGRLVDADENPIPNTPVHAINAQTRPLNRATTDADGNFSMNLPAGTYTFRARTSSIFAESAPLEVGPDTPDVSLQAERGGTLRVLVQTPDNTPIPARVSVLCEGPCPNPPTSQDENRSNNALPSGYAAIGYAHPNGAASLALHAGTYRVVVSRGMEWSVWPQDAIETGGVLVEIQPGEEHSIQAEIAHVIDSSGAIGADFHVHAIRSQDSQVTEEERILNFVSEGLDVLVSTDHDVITDFAPVIDRLNLTDHIVSVPGSEITAAELGHFNAFPLPHDPESPVGGALDWSNGPQPNLTPKEIFAWVDAQPNEQVIQVNHPGGHLGTFNSLGVDPLLGTTRTEAADLKLPEAPEDAKRDALDTGLWSETFTAIEVMNGNGRPSAWAVMRWWMTMLGRGFVSTATAVTDTHTQYSGLGGSPRSFVFVPEHTDSIATFDTDTFTQHINAGRLIGTNGPFFHLTLTNERGDEATLGDTLSIEGLSSTVQARLDVQTPHWMKVDTLDLYINPRDEVVTPDGREETSPIPPTFSIPIALTEQDLQTVTTGVYEHARYQKTIAFDLPPIAEDAFVVAVLRGDSDATPHMYPILSRRSVKPFAFSNPIYIDFDGGGYQTYPLLDLVEARLNERAQGSSKPAQPHPHESINVWDLSPEEFLNAIQHHTCSHEH